MGLSHLAERDAWVWASYGFKSLSQERCLFVAEVVEC